MKQVSNRVKNFVLYYDHHNHVSNSNWKDTVVNPVSSLPKVLNPKKVEHIPMRFDEKLPSFYNNIQSSSGGDIGVGSEAGIEDDDTEDSDFVDSEYEVQNDDDDLFYDNVDETVIDNGVGRGKNISKGKKSGIIRYNVMESDTTQRDWDQLSTDDEELELPESDREAEVGKNLKSFRPEDVNNPIFKIGMKFPSVEVLRKAINVHPM